jgi:asparagine synthase (glutamine-hydrolysing)
MSAFAGFVSIGTDVPPGTAERLSKGLDGKGLGKAVVRRFDQGVFVFRQRVLSPEDRYERQPSVGADGHVLSMFDGRLDNRSEVLDALGLHSPSHLPVPDGEIVRAAYQRWEEDTVPRLLGEFAWAVWNARDGRLMLARDHSQNRALFFSNGDGFTAFATGYRPLLALPQIPRDIDDLAIADLLLTSPDESGRSVYKAISWVGAAERVVVTASSVRRDRFWEPAPRPMLRLPRDADYLDAARGVFEAAVACRLRVAGPVVSSVSGGLDSSSVAATAACRVAPGIVHGLCIVPVAGAYLSVREHEYADERPFVAALAMQHPNLQVEYLESTEVRPFELDPRQLFLESGAPLRAPSNAAWFLPMLHRAAELGATTLLRGDLGNLTFSAEGFTRLSALRQGGAWLTLAREFAALRLSLPSRSWRVLARYQTLALLPDRVRAELRRIRRHRSPPLSRNPVFLNPDFVQDAGLDARNTHHGVSRRDFWAANGMASLLRYVLQRSRMQVESSAALRGMTGVTSSDPFSDRRVIDFCLSLPPDQFLRNGEWRRLARGAFADRLPTEIIENRKRGAQNTDWHTRLTPYRPTLAAELERLSGSGLATRILDVPRMKHILAGWPDDPRAVEGDGQLYRVSLLRALHVGQYLRWIDGGNR